MADFKPVKKVEEDFKPIRKISDTPSIGSVPEWGIRSPNLYGAAGATFEALKPVGQAVAFAGGVLQGGPPGAGLAYGIEQEVEKLIQEKFFNKPGQPLMNRMGEASQNVAIGLGGEIAAPALGKIAKEVGAPVMGALTGRGRYAIEKAVGASSRFRDALTKKISGAEIVEHARDALSVLKAKRSEAYQADLADLAKLQGPIDVQPIKDAILGPKGILKRYARIKQNGEIDWGKSALGPEKSEGVAKMKQMIDIIKNWGVKKSKPKPASGLLDQYGNPIPGTPGATIPDPEDTTALGLDMLKRQLDDFFSESSNARAFVTEARNIVKKELVENVPEYAKMTKKYAEATNLIKDIEQGLMLRKHGMTGRVYADMTLRRLVSAMRDNFELRRELIDSLGNKATMDIADEVAGYAMSHWTPGGVLGGGAGLTGQAALAYFISPKFWPVLVASSPRISSEFLYWFGRGLKEYPNMAKVVGQITSLESGRKVIKPDEKSTSVINR